MTGEHATVRILVADDCRTSRDILRALCWLPDREIEITEVETGLAALNAFVRRPFDLVFLDLDMPGMKGHEVLGRMKAMDKDCPVVMVTGDGTEATVRATIARGADSYVIKPVNRDGLRKVLEKFV